MPKPPEGRQAAARELGLLIRRARSGRNQRAIAEAAGFSDSTLSRFEKGKQVPDLVQARQLDDLFGTGDVIQGYVRQILFNPMPAALTFPRRFYTAPFPPFYIGAVYVLLSSDEVVRDVEVMFKWSSRRRTFTVEAIDRGGMAFVCTKMDDDEHPSPLRIHTSVPLHITAGYGMPMLDDERIVDCHDGWELD